MILVTTRQYLVSLNDDGTVVRWVRRSVLELSLGCAAPGEPKEDKLLSERVATASAPEGLSANS